MLVFLTSIQVQSRDVENKTALHIASEFGCAGQLHALLKALHSFELINETIDVKSDVSLFLVDSITVEYTFFYLEHILYHLFQGDYTPLHLAAKTGQSTCAKLLLDYGANPFLKTQYVSSCFDRVSFHIIAVFDTEFYNDMSRE